MSSDFHLRPLRAGDVRLPFDCGQPELDRHLKQFTRRDTTRDLSRVYVLLETRTGRLADDYTLAMTSIDTGELPREVQQQLPCPRPPAILIGRLAVDRSFHGRGLGTRLMRDIFHRCLSVAEHIVAVVIVVDAIDEVAARFYEAFDFRQVPDRPRRLFIPMQTVRDSLPSGPP